MVLIFNNYCGRHAWDLYAGIGEAGRLLHQGGATVDSVERDAAAVAVAEQAGPAEGIRRHTGPVEDWVGRMTPPAVVFTNPPRSGMEPAVVAALARAGPAVILYSRAIPPPWPGTSGGSAPGTGWL